MLFAQMSFAYEPLVSSRGTTAVIDGDCVLLTTLRHTLVPPPLCTSRVQLSAVATCIGIRDHGQSEVTSPFWQHLQRIYEDLP